MYIMLIISFFSVTALYSEKKKVFFYLLVCVNIHKLLANPIKGLVMAKYSGIISIVNIMNRFVDTHHIILVTFSYLDLLVYSYAYECTLKFIPIIGALVSKCFFC